MLIISYITRKVILKIYYICYIGSNICITYVYCFVSTICTYFQNIFLFPPKNCKTKPDILLENHSTYTYLNKGQSKFPVTCYRLCTLNNTCRQGRHLG